MLGWSIKANACRSASMRAITCVLSIPGLITLRATLRWTGWVCSASQTEPMPPSPIGCKSLYGPTRPPDSSGGPPAAGPSTGRARKPPGLSAASSRASRCRRSASSPRHASARNAPRSPAGFSRAWWNSFSSFIVVLRAARRSLYPPQRETDRRSTTMSDQAAASLPAHRRLEPGAGVDPVAVGGARRDAQGLARLLARQPHEITQLDQPGHDRLGRGQLLQRLVQRQQLLVRLRGGGVRERLALGAAAPLLGVLPPRVLNEDTAHRLGGGGEEVLAVGVPPRHGLPDEAQVRLVDQRGRLEGVARLLAGQLRGGEAPQLVVDQRQQLAGGLRVALLDGGQDSCDLAHGGPV